MKSAFYTIVVRMVRRSDGNPSRQWMESPVSPKKSARFSVFPCSKFATFIVSWFVIWQQKRHIVHLRSQVTPSKTVETILPSSNVCGSYKMAPPYFGVNQLKDGCSADQISALPEVILAEILSLLTLKEAARTSVLSKRWIDLWKCVTDLDFDASKARHAIRGEDEVGCDMNLLAKERNKYIKWVNQVLERHKGPKVKSFRIKFNLNSEQSNPDCDIDRWVVFAISKRVKRMEVDLDRYCDVNINAKGCCVLSEPCFNYIRTAEGLSNIRFLQSLILRYVNMRSEILEHFLCNCPLLEKLVVVRSHGLVKFKVAGSGSCLPLLKLKHLDVSVCDYLKEMEIHAPNLSHFIYSGPKIDLHMKNVSSLAGLEFRLRDNSPGYVFLSPNKFAQLEALTLKIDTRNVQFPKSIEELPSLKRLTLEVFNSCKASLLGLIPLINASPCLYKLSLRLLTYGKARDIFLPKDDETEMKRHSIKVVEVTGFAGGSAYCIASHFLDYVIRNFVMLEKLVLDHRRHFASGKVFESSTEDAQVAEKCISRLKSKLSSTIELVAV